MVFVDFANGVKLGEQWGDPCQQKLIPVEPT